jgi:hypothetical protein
LEWCILIRINARDAPLEQAQILVGVIAMPARDPFQQFLDLVPFMKPSSVMEVGTSQAIPGRSTHHMAWFPDVLRSQYTMVDIVHGPDVDVVANIHALPKDWAACFGAVVAVSVFEHLERPWIAAAEVGRVLARGGICYIATHHTFPLHEYPGDYFRFSKEALSLIFSDAGLQVIDAAYQYRCQIIPPPEVVPPSHVETWNETWPSFLNVHLIAKKE